MISSHIPTFIYSNTKKARSGIGVIPRVSIYGNEIYDKLLSRKEVICRLLNKYFPYYKKLKFIIKSLKDKFNNILILDFHSMPSNSLRYNSDIILGNNYNLSCSKVLTSLIKEYFNSYNYKVLENYPYSGGYITKSLGKLEIGVNILQIEINRAIYMNEKTLFKHHHNMQLLSKNIKEIIINLGQNINNI
jgi:N-formylglutamate amidohydrolase